MKIKNFSEVVTQIQSHLNDYLQSHGIDSNKMFHCINPSHPDKSPSCGTGGSGDGNLFHCFGCGSSGDIFTAAHFLEQKPLVGKEFIVDNLIYLANKYDIKVESTPLSEDEIYELDTYRAYKFASEYIANSKWTESFTKAIEDRVWTKELCTSYGVGCVSSFKDFRHHLKDLGFQASFLDDVDLGRKELFDDNHVIYTVKDDYGRPVGFASRNLKYTEDKQNGEKYVNQKTTGAKCNIYKKGTRLFGIDQLTKRHHKKSDSIYIFEGYSDVVTAAQSGLTNCVALGGTSFSIEQLHLLKDHGYYNLILCLDGDEAGQKRTAALLDTTLGGHKDVRVGVVIIPAGQDPDDFIRENGITKFKELKKYSAFEWRLEQFSPETDAEVVCQSMIPLIVNESSFVHQERMCKTLCNSTGISLKTIESEVTRLQNARENEKMKERQNILDKLKRVIEKSPSEAEFALHDANSALFELDRKYNEDSFSEDKCLAVLDTQKQVEESKDGTFAGFLLGEDLKTLEEALCGDWKKDVWLVFGGKANAGKTSLLAKISYELAKRRDENNALVIFHTIDDTAEQLIPKLICVAEATRGLTINQVNNPKYWQMKGKKDVFDRREVGYSSVRELIRDGRIIVKDANDGASIAYADRLIAYYKMRYPDRNVVYILDNFHKLQDFHSLSGGDERVRFKQMSTIMKGLATKHHIPVLSTAEYTKLEKGQKPTNNNIGETVQIEYDANLIAHLYNDIHEQGEMNATHYHVSLDSDGDVKRLPRIELNIGKNKISGFKNKIWFDFYPESSDFVCVDPEIPEEEEKKAKEGKKAKKKQDMGGEIF